MRPIIDIVFDLIADSTPWYMDIAVWCYIINTAYLLLFLPSLFGILTNQLHLTFQMPDTIMFAWSQTGLLIELLIGYSLIDILQQVGYKIYLLYLALTGKENDL
jgi:hypothetical protein